MLGFFGRCDVARLLIVGVAFVAATDGLQAAEKKIVKKTYTFKTVNTGASLKKIQADVYRPDDEVIRPVVMWIHGGALIVGNRTSIKRRVRQSLLDAGYAVVSIDYRLAPETKLPKIIEDVEDAYRWLHREGPALFHVDTSRIAVMGGSAGGYLTLTAGFRAKPRPAVLVSFWGYGDLIGEWYSKPSPFYRKRPLVTEAEAIKGMYFTPAVTDGVKRKGSTFYLYCRQNGLWPKLVSGFDPHTQPKAFFPYMPVKNVTKDYPPTLLIHGTVDTDVPYEQSVLMAEQFESKGVEHQFVTVRDAGHGLANGDKKRVDEAYQAVLPFIDRFMKKP